MAPRARLGERAFRPESQQAQVRNVPGGRSRSGQDESRVFHVERRRARRTPRGARVPSRACSAVMKPLQPTCDPERPHPHACATGAAPRSRLVVSGLTCRSGSPRRPRSRCGTDGGEDRELAPPSMRTRGVVGERHVQGMISGPRPWTDLSEASLRAQPSVPQLARPRTRVVPRGTPASPDQPRSRQMPLGPGSLRS